ncbi:amino acid permease [Neofusicoccum parvum]|uniref:Amino acid permease n=1 Tax=Neofusicoccum parvum TaxID=310453 RepID=A0ACB5SH17_9PEZI|nr:amino acid permease [Neofusicoccum parvum]
MTAKKDAAEFSAEEAPRDGSLSIELESGVADDGNTQLKRALGARHINMIAIAGMIGTGLFLSSGQNVAKAGPVGALLGYIFMGLITSGVAYTTAEVTAFMPVSGGFVRHATRFLEPALGAATGWNFWYTMSISVPAEISAAATLIQFWNDSINPAVFITIFLVFILAINFSGVRLYGESEVIFASLKIMLIVGLIIAGLVVDLGGGPSHDRIGFRYWKNPGAFNEYLVDGVTGRFLAFWGTLVSAAFAYGNIQVVAISGTETRDPRRIIPQATKTVFYRILVFYVLSIFIIGLIIPYNDEGLLASSGTAATSPFVLAFERAGIKVLPSIINAVVMTSAVSSGSACVFIASRTLYGLSVDGLAPKWLQTCNRFGTPYYAVALTAILSPLVYLNVSNNTSTVFAWFVNITTVAGLIGWLVVEASYLRFYYALKVQGISRDELPYKGPFQPYTAWATLLAVFLVIFFSGFDVFFPGNWSVATFITCYLNIPIFAAMYIIAKFSIRSPMPSLAEISFMPELREISDERATWEHEDKPSVIGKMWKNIF